MSNAVFPGAIRGLDIAVTKSAEFETIVQSAPSFSETRIAQAQNPRWHWQLTYNYLKDDWDDLSVYVPYTDYKTMQGFFLARQGQFDDFLYLDPDDNFVGPALYGAVPNPLAQLQTVTDGVGNYYSPIQRNFGGQFWEDITDIGGITVYANGALQTVGVNYNIFGPGLAIPGYSFGGKYIQWIASGSPALPVTAQFQFFFRVRFEEDTQDFERWLWQLWNIGGPNQKNGSGELKLITARPAGA
jgi:Conserved hypothetical protein 2217 (DUF2460)